MPGRVTSNVYFARPLTLSGPSRRLTRVPTTVFGVDVQLYFGSTGGACGAPPRPCFEEGLATPHPLYFMSRGASPLELPGTLARARVRARIRSRERAPGGRAIRATRRGGRPGALGG